MTTGYHIGQRSLNLSLTFAHQLLLFANDPDFTVLSNVAQTLIKNTHLPDTMLYIENPKENPEDAARKLLELINGFGKFAGYKINTQKICFISIHKQKISEREIKETIPFTITLKRIKYQGINLPKEAKDLYSKNYKMLMKEIKDNTNRWKDILCS